MKNSDKPNEPPGWQSIRQNAQRLREQSLYQRHIEDTVLAWRNAHPEEAERIEKEALVELRNNGSLDSYGAFQQFTGKGIEKIVRAHADKKIAHLAGTPKPPSNSSPKAPQNNLNGLLSKIVQHNIKQAVLINNEPMLLFRDDSHITGSIVSFGQIAKVTAEILNLEQKLELKTAGNIVFSLQVDSKIFEIAVVQSKNEMIMSIRPLSQQASGSDSAGVYATKFLCDKGLAIFKEKNYNKALILFKNIVFLFYIDQHPAVRTQLCRAHFNAAVCHAQLGNTKAAINDYLSVIELFTQDKSVDTQYFVFRALRSLAFNLADWQGFKGSIETYDLMLEYFANSPENTLREVMVYALMERSQVHYKFSDYAGALAVIDYLSDVFKDDFSPKIQESITRAQLNKAQILYAPDVRGFKEGLKVCDDIINQYRPRDDSQAQEFLAQALIHRAWHLFGLGHSKDAIVTCDYILTHFNSLKGSIAQDALSHAKSSKRIFEEYQVKNKMDYWDEVRNNPLIQQLNAEFWEQHGNS